jgi:hypothetical protein
VLVLAAPRRAAPALTDQGDAADCILEERSHLAQGLLVERVHLGPDGSKLTLHLGAHGRKLTVHLGAKLHNLRRQRIDPGGQFLESRDAVFEPFHLFSIVSGVMNGTPHGVARAMHPGGPTRGDGEERAVADDDTIVGVQRR